MTDESLAASLQNRYLPERELGHGHGDGVGLPLSTRQAVRFSTKNNPAATAPQLYRFTESGFEERECPVEVSI